MGGKLCLAPLGNDFKPDKILELGCVLPEMRFLHSPHLIPQFWYWNMVCPRRSSCAYDSESSRGVRRTIEAATLYPDAEVLATDINPLPER
jgi:hypothetical protein